MTTYDYAAMPGVNWSSLKHLATSPLLYLYRSAHQEPDTSAYVAGRVLHCAVFEPHKLDAMVAVYDERRSGKPWDAWRENHPGVSTLKSHELAPLMEASLAVRRHRVAEELLAAVRVEEPLTWTDAETGTLCKGRLDAIRADCVIDLKSSRDVPTARNVAAAAARYLYHGQLAYYHDGAIAAGTLTPSADPPWLITVQKDAPYDVACDQMNLQDLQAGRDLYRGLLRQLRACADADYWPGVAPEARQLVLPSWAPGIAAAEEEIF